MKRVLRREFVFFISVNAGWKSTVGLCSPHFVPCHCFLSGFFFFYFCQSPVFVSFLFTAAAEGFLPEQFFKLFTRRLAALTLCFGSISQGDVLPLLPCSPAFALLPKPANNLSLQQAAHHRIWKSELIYDEEKYLLSLHV